MIQLNFETRLRGCLLAGACGDALGAPVEFMSLAQIRCDFGPAGIRDFAPAYGRRGAITDDTQMTLFTLEGLLRTRVRHASRGISHTLTMLKMAYDRWLRTQDEPFPGVAPDAGLLLNTPALWSRRAPGVTCLGALRAKEAAVTPARNDSKGCGGVMRVAPIGFLADNPFELGCEAAALTHGHPTGAIAAGALALLIAAIVRKGGDLRGAVEIVLQRLASAPHGDETREALQTACRLATDGAKDIPAALGGGWIAEEALAIAIFACLSESDPCRAIVRAVNHDGDSDSTGSIAGNILGALHGDAWLPTTWRETLELADLIAEMAADATADDEAVLSDRFWRRYPGF